MSCYETKLRESLLVDGRRLDELEAPLSIQEQATVIGHENAVGSTDRLLNGQLIRGRLHRSTYTGGSLGWYCYRCRLLTTERNLITIRRDETPLTLSRRQRQ